jgi:hypothetical protein
MNTNTEDNLDKDVVKQPQNIVNKNHEIQNPFFVGFNNDLLKLSKKELYNISDRVLLLCIKNNLFRKNRILSKIFNDGLDLSYDLDEKMLKSLNTNNINNIHINDFLTNNINEYKLNFFGNIFTLIPGSKKLLKNYIHLTECILVDREHLHIFNNNYLELNSNELILISFISEDEDKVRKYNSRLSGSFTMNDYIDMEILYNKFNNSNYQNKNFQTNHNKIKDNIIDMLSEFRHNNYFSNSYPKNININTNFNKRSFQYKTILEQSVITTNTDNKISKKNILINKLSTMKIGENEDYLSNIFRKDLYNNFVQMSDNAYYKISEPSLKLTKENIIDLFNYRRTAKDKFKMFNELLLSKDYCHLVLNNHYILKESKRMFNKFKLLYKVYIGYAWSIFRLEESIKKTRVLTTDRFIIDLNTAAELPLYEYCEDLKQCPYLPITIKEELYKGIVGIKMGIPLLKNKVKAHQLCNLELFKLNLNIFTTGLSDKNIFDGLDWTNKSISGSSLIACVYVKHPLMDIISNNDYYNNIDNKKRLFNEYWGNSDIDLMCYSTNIHEYYKNVIDIFNCVKNNLKKIREHDIIINKHINIDINKTSSIVISKYYIEKYLNYVKLDYIKKNIHSNEIKELFYELYIVKKMERRRNNNSTSTPNVYNYNTDDSKLIKAFDKLVNIDELKIYITDDYIEVNHEFDNNIYIYQKDIEKQFTDNDNKCLIKICENTKFKIKSHLLERPIEIFKIRYQDPFSCVSRFHLNCVRMYYNGDNLYMLPSCYSALTTFINMDYKYFAGIRDPIEILNKYSTRGFGIILNDKEKVHMLKYNSTLDQWNKIMKLNINSKSSMKAHFGPLLLSNEIFRVTKYSQNLPDDIYNNDNYYKNKENYIITQNDLKNVYKKDYPSELVDMFFKYTTINEEGNINKIRTWLADYIWDYYETLEDTEP